MTRLVRDPVDTAVPPVVAGGAPFHPDAAGMAAVAELVLAVLARRNR